MSRDVDTEVSDVGENVLVHSGFILNRSVWEPICAFDDNCRDIALVDIRKPQRARPYAPARAISDSVERAG